MIRLSGINEPQGLEHVNVFVQGTVQEGILHVELIDLPSIHKSNVQDCSYYGWSHDRAESLVEVDTLLLRFPISYKPGFVFLESSLCIILVFV